MNYIDLVLVIILIIAAFQGFQKGFIVELASLAALILGIWGAIKFSDWTAGFITKTTGFHSDNMNTIAFVLTFIAIVILIHILGKVLDSAIKAVAVFFFYSSTLLTKMSIFFLPLKKLILKCIPQ